MRRTILRSHLLVEEHETSMKALIIVDVQNDFLKDGALEVPEGDKVVPLINQLQEKFPLVVATQDWHPPGHESFASMHTGKEPFEQISLHGLSQVLWPDHCVQGTRGAELAAQLNTNRVEAIFRKGMEKEIDSYSGFFDNGGRKSTGLTDYLKGRNVQEVYVAGLAGDYCVNYTANDALKLGFEPTVIADATRSIDSNGFERAMERFTEQGGKVIYSSQL